MDNEQIHKMQEAHAKEIRGLKAVVNDLDKQLVKARATIAAFRKGVDGIMEY